jgi:hypothetical protein
MFRESGAHMPFLGGGGELFVVNWPDVPVALHSSCFFSLRNIKISFVLVIYSYQGLVMCPTGSLLSSYPITLAPMP